MIIKITFLSVCALVDLDLDVGDLEILIGCLFGDCDAELYKMVCSENETFTDITIPSVLLPKSAGKTLENALLHDGQGR